MRPRVLVVQMGARRSYQLARMLEARGALAGLYSDAAWHENSRSLTKGLISQLAPSSRAALIRRTVREIPPYKFRSSSTPNILGAVAKAAKLETERRHRLEDWALGAHARRWGLSDANIVLNTSGNGGGAFLGWAKRKTMKIASDIVITPLAHEILAEETALWPGWTDDSHSRLAVRIYRRHVEALVAVSDLLLCASETVVDGLASVRGFTPEKVARVPYGLGHAAMEECRPEQKRVLFAGHAGLRKGLPYLARAASILKARDPGCAVVVAGGVTDRVRTRPECRDLTFLGHLNQAAMSGEFARADVFCLPSLAEGSASVVLEALAHGLPCVVTRSAGAPVVDGEQGVIVAERDADALADAIWSIVADRNRRARMSGAARTLAGEHNLEMVGARLYHALEGLVAPQPGRSP